MTTILKTQGLTKKYSRLTALNKLNLTIQPGEVFGLLGPNGSGKTTTLGLLLGVLKPTSGSFAWFDEKPFANSRKKIGAILEKPCFYPYMTAIQNLQVVAEIKRCDKSSIEKVLKTVGIYKHRNDSFKTFSLGMKQRLAIGSALLADPPVLILDEPTNGLDPQGIVETREIIQQIASYGKTIILASHLLDEVQKICTHFAVLKNGKKLYQGRVNEVLAEQSTIEIAAKDMNKLKIILENFERIKQITKKSDIFILKVDKTLKTSDINSYLFDYGIVATHLVQKTNTLEKEFLKILKEND